jgi:hypothetical protein
MSRRAQGGNHQRHARPHRHFESAKVTQLRESIDDAVGQITDARRHYSTRAMDASWLFVPKRPLVPLWRARGYFRLLPGSPTDTRKRMGSYFACKQERE